MDSDREDESPDFPLDSPTDLQHDLATPVEPREPGTKQDETVAVNVSGQEESEEPERPNGAKLQPGELVKRLQRAQANSHATNAVKLHKQQKLDQALSEISRAIYLQNDEATYFELRAKIYQDMSDFRSAISNLKKVIKLTNGETHVLGLLSFLLNAQGLASLRLRNFDAAVHELNAAIENDKLNNAAYLHRALALIAIGSQQEALNDLDHFCSVDNATASVYLMRARLNYDLKNMKKAGMDITLGLNRDPNDEHLLALQREIRQSAAELFSSANKFLLAEQYDEALQMMSMAIDLDEQDSQYYLRRALTLRYLNRFKEAEVDLEKCISLAVGSASAVQTQLAKTLNEHAVHLYSQKEYMGAVRLLDKAMVLDPKLVSLYLNHGDCMIALGREIDAELAYKHAWELDGSNWECRMRLARIYEKRGVLQYNVGHSAKSFHWFSEAIKAYPNVAEYHFNRATASMRLGRFKDVHDDLQRVVALDPHNHEAWLKLQQFRKDSPLDGLAVQWRRAV